jgi:SH3-like domain-containing protein
LTQRGSLDYQAFQGLEEGRGTMRQRASTRGASTKGASTRARARSVAGQATIWWAAGLVAAWLWLAPALAQDHLPLPRFASLDSNEVNLRAGPGTDYPILWVYQRKGLPVEIIQEFDTWRRIRDRDGTVGWVQQGLLSGKRGALVIDEARTLRTDPTGGAKAVAILQPGVVAEIAECGTDNWCRMEVKGYKGWLRRDDFWGTYPDEVFEGD